MFQGRNGALQTALRKTALAVGLLYTGALLAPAVHAATYQPPRPAGHVRALSVAEMGHIVGAHIRTTGPESGDAYPWEGENAGTNTVNGNKLTTLPLVGWSARGGLPVQFALHHNSRGTHNGELGSKWTHSFEIYGVEGWDAAENWVFTVHWGDDLAYSFIQNIDGSYSAPAGIFDTLTPVGSPVTAFDLKTKNQVVYRFTQPNGTGWYCTKITDRNNNQITLAYTTGDEVSTITDPTSRTLTLGYTSVPYVGRRLTSVTDPLSRQWTIGYDSPGRVQTITYPSVGGSTYTQQVGYTSTNNNIASLTDRRGKAWTFGYNTDNSVAWEKDPLLNQTSYAYTSTYTDITDPNGNVTRHTYDTSGRLASVRDAALYSESYTYNASNLRTRVTDKRGKYWDYTFDSWGNVLTAKNPLLKTTTFTYTAKNDLDTVTTARGHFTDNNYDTNGNLTRTETRTASGGTILTAVDCSIGSYGLVASKTDANSHATSYGYNTNGDLTSVSTPNSRLTQFGYNALGVRNSRTDALGRTTSYTLDNWNRVTLADFPAGTDQTFTYDANNSRTQFVDATGTTTCVYDDANRLTSESKGGTTVVSYAYDATGKKGLLSTVTDANSRVLTYAYSVRNQLASVAETGGTASYGYDAAGNETSVTNPNATTVTKVYDDAGRLSSLTNKTSGGTTLSSFAYGYDDDSRRTSCTEASGAVVSYGYDGANRLTSEGRTGANAFSTTYSVDGASNRTSQTVGTATTAFTYNNDDELTSTSSTTGGFVNSYGYNLNGEQTTRTLSGTAYTLAYDYDGQLTSITQGANTTSFAYDALGRRTSRTSGGVSTTFLRTGDTNGGQVLLEKQGATTTRTYTYGNALVRMNTEYPLFDGLGSERTVTDSSQTVTGTLTSEAFGQTVASTGSSSNPYMFAATSGYRNDGDAGLSHVGARYYDAQVGRFITRDTYLDQKPYAYCEHDPVNATDPSGHLHLIIVVVALGIFVIGGLIILVILPVVTKYINRIGRRMKNYQLE